MQTLGQDKALQIDIEWWDLKPRVQTKTCLSHQRQKIKVSETEVMVRRIGFQLPNRNSNKRATSENCICILSANKAIKLRHIGKNTCKWESGETRQDLLNMAKVWFVVAFFLLQMIERNLTSMDRVHAKEKASPLASHNSKTRPKRWEHIVRTRSSFQDGIRPPGLEIFCRDSLASFSLYFLSFFFSFFLFLNQAGNITGTGIFKMALYLSDEDKFVFLKMLNFCPWIWDSLPYKGLTQH